MRPDPRNAQTSGGDAINPGVARDLSELARQLQTETSADAVLQAIVGAAVTEVEGAEHAGISFITERQVTTPAQTDELVGLIDRLQYQANDGPCLTSLRTERTVRAEDLSEDSRWPKFARAAADLGVRSMLSVQLFVEGENLGALNLYATGPGAFTDADENTALLLASHAAIALADARRVDNLKTALESRDVIGQAKGILMERFKVDAQGAFRLLIAVSQHTNVKLSVLSERLAETGELPDLPPT